jgi:outer membrane usher protein FimD/PapC
LISGAEILGGDVQVNSQISRAASGNSAGVNSWRYRYYHGDKPWLSQTFIGDVSASGGTLKSAMTGIRFTNEPLYPDRVFDYYTISELTMPDSEVELFINDRLTDFTTTDEQGRFTFQIPIVYGPNDIKVVIYGPGGELIESNRSIRVPFNFVPKGEFRYDSGFGLDENVFEGGDDQFGYVRAGYGVSSKLTIGATSEYLRTPSEITKKFTSATVNARLPEGRYSSTIRTASGSPTGSVLPSGSPRWMATSPPLSLCMIRVVPSSPSPSPRRTTPDRIVNPPFR